jgi:hypothetical protein
VWNTVNENSSILSLLASSFSISLRGANLNKGAPLVWVTKQMGIQNKMTREWPRGFGDIRVTFGDKWENPSTTMEEGTLTSFPQRRNQ